MTALAVLSTLAFAGFLMAGFSVKPFSTLQMTYLLGALISAAFAVTAWIALA